MCIQVPTLTLCDRDPPPFPPLFPLDPKLRQCSLSGFSVLPLGVDALVAPTGARVLPAHLDTPVVSQTAMQADALHALQVVTERRVKEIGVLLARLAVLHVPVSVEHVRRDLELKWIVQHCHDLVHLIGGEFASTLVQVDVALLADDVGETASNTFDGSEREHDLLTSVHVRVAHSQDVLEILRLHLDRHGGLGSKRTLQNRAHPCTRKSHRSKIADDDTKKKPSDVGVRWSFESAVMCRPGGKERKSLV